MAGIYVHIPFCKRACHYCNFHFSTSFDKKDDLIEAIAAEARIRVKYPGRVPIHTVYFGGGTPSALPVRDIEVILETIRLHYKVVSDAEITLEANPDDITLEKLQGWKRSGINRLSIGVQAFQNDLLREWNRNHDALQAEASLSLAKLTGFENITADLIYGANALSDEEWKRNINLLIDSGIPHVSSYALTVESGTVLAHQIKTGKAKPLQDEHSNRQYSILQKMLGDAGYEQYEISNFAKPGFRSKHNSAYWRGYHYLGLGPSAHSYDGVSRQWNVANNVKYTLALRQGVIPFEREVLTPVQCFNEIVMTGLRTSDGIDRARIKKLGDEFDTYLTEEVKPLIEAGKININAEGNFFLMPEYYFYADGIAADLFMTEEGSAEKEVR